MPDQDGAPRRLTAMLRRRWMVVAAVVGSRLVVVIGQLAGLSVGTSHRSLARRWDGAWYVRIARLGYPAHLHIPGTRYSPWAFFPLYPLLVRGAHAATGPRLATAALAVNGVLCVALAVALWQLILAVSDPATADRGSVLFWFFPGSAVLSMAYSEPLFLLAACVTLVCLLRHRWLLAGLAGVAATATRPDGLAVEAACVVAFLMTTRRALQPAWGALAAVALCPLGLLGFLAYSQQRTGNALIWRQAENLWHQRLDWNTGLPGRLSRNLSHRNPHTIESVLLLVGLALLAIGLGFAVRDRAQLPAELWAYLAVILLLSVGYTNVSAKLRFVLVMVPLFVSTARRLSTSATMLVAGGLGGILGFASFAYVGLSHVAP